MNSKALLKSLALMNGRTAVTQADYDAFLNLSTYFNAEFNPISSVRKGGMTA